MVKTKKRRVLIIVIVVCVGLVVGGLIAFRWNFNNQKHQDVPLQNDTAQYIQGIVTHVEPGKDGVQVELETENGFYNVTISTIQAEIEGAFEQIKFGAEIEVMGQIIAGMEPPLIVAEQVKVLEGVNSVASNLEGHTWVVTDLNGGDPLDGHRPTLEFQAGEVSGNTGCNHYGGSYQMEGDSIRFEGIFSTEMACLDPEGLMDQERIYLELIPVADQFELTDGILTFYAESNPILVFEIQSYEPISSEPTIEPENPVSVALAPSPTSLPVFEPPEGFNRHQDQITGISIYIPGNWIVTSIIEGQSAILQSYPEDKYVGGEVLATGDTKCDLNIRPEGASANELIQQWKSDSMTTIISEDTFNLQTGSMGQRFIIDSMGRSTVFIMEIQQRAVVLTCFGDFTQADEIAKTLKVLE